jgi:hypothetical protein
MRNTGVTIVHPTANLAAQLLPDQTGDDHHLGHVDAPPQKAD